jgi:hypothetical protein
MTVLKYLCVVGLLGGGLLISACGGSSTPPVTQAIATATPHATPIDAATPPAEPVANSFRFEVTGAGEDKIIEGGLVQYAPALQSHSWALTEVGNFARYGATLFTPVAIEAGEHPLIPYSFDYAEGYSAAIFIGAWFYQASAGTLIIDEVSDNTISGRFEFTASREDDASQVVQVKGEFKQIPVPPVTRSTPVSDSPTAKATLEPAVTPEATAGTTTQAAAGEFWFGAANADLDVFVGSGLIQSDLAPSGSAYRLTLQEDSDTAPHVVTLFLPFDLTPGEITLKPYAATANPIEPSATFSIGSDVFGALAGTLTLDEVSGDTITGSFAFKAVSSSATEKSIDVTGEFSGVALAGRP